MVALGPPRVRFCIGHVNFMLFVLFSFALLPKMNTVSGGIWAMLSELEIHFIRISISLGKYFRQ